MRVIITGGGTGGHLIPGITLAERFVEKGHEVMFVCGRGKIDLMLLSRTRIPYKTLPAKGFAGKGLFKKIFALMLLLFSTMWAIKILLRYSPDCVIGVGGYASMPVSLATVLLRKPLFLQEQNSVPGVANRFLSRFARKIFIAFENSKKYLPEDRCMLTGNPIRKEFVHINTDRGESEDFRLLILGGSQGSTRLNRLISETLKILKERGVRFRCVHQTGQNNAAEMREVYGGIGLSDVVEVRPFIDDIWNYYVNADLVVCRAGALTVSEVIATESVAIFVPLPESVGNHQYLNAKTLAEDNAGFIVKEEDGAEVLADLIEELYISDEKIEIVRSRVRLHKKRDPAETIVDGVLEECS